MSEQLGTLDTRNLCPQLLRWMGPIPATTKRNRRINKNHHAQSEGLLLCPSVWKALSEKANTKKYSSTLMVSHSCVSNMSLG